MAAPEIFLHHYDQSPYAEKARCALGMKAMSWRSVIVPNMLPKPKLAPLTGGYRRVPVMQIEADIYCDNAMIVRELERRFPEPTLFSAGRLGMPFALAKWSDGEFLQATACLVFPLIEDQLPDGFIADRTAMRGAPFDIAAMRKAAPAMRDQWRAFAGWIDDHLGDGKDWVMGARPGYADINAYMNVWFLKLYAPDIAAQLLAGLTHTRRWAEAMAEIGHGDRQESDADAALAAARDAEPATAERADPDDPFGRKPGDEVIVTPADYAKDSIAGTLVASSHYHIAIRRSAAEVGTVVVHFPRAGYHVRSA